MTVNSKSCAASCIAPSPNTHLDRTPVRRAPSGGRLKFDDTQSQSYDSPSSGARSTSPRVSASLADRALLRGALNVNTGYLADHTSATRIWLRRWRFLRPAQVSAPALDPRIPAAFEKSNKAHSQPAGRIWHVGRPGLAPHEGARCRDGGTNVVFVVIKM